MNHTPGEWRAGGIYVECNNVVLAVVDSNQTAHRERRKRAPLLEEAHANARVMAAASDLLAAVEQFVRYADNGKHTQLTQYMATIAGGRMRAAIEKATGKQ